jgi:hypothetical protein
MNIGAKSNVIADLQEVELINIRWKIEKLETLGVLASGVLGYLHEPEIQNLALETQATAENAKLLAEQISTKSSLANHNADDSIRNAVAQSRAAAEDAKVNAERAIKIAKIAADHAREEAKKAIERQNDIESRRTIEARRIEIR